MTSDEFHQFADLIRKEKGDVKEDIREQEVNQLKLSKKRSDFEQKEIDVLVSRRSSE